MRDIAVTILFFFLIFYTVKRPYIGVCAWLWVALAYPAGWAWGFSSSFRMNFTVALLTMFSYLLYKKKPKVAFDGTTILIVIFWSLALISALVSNSIIIDFVWAKFTELSKIFLLYLFIILIFEKKIHIDTLIWSIVLAVSSYGAMEATKFIVSGGGHRITGFYGHVLGDRNDLAVAINMCIPLIVYLLNQTKHKQIKLGLVALLILNIVAVVGTYSRGGFVGLIIVGGYFFFKSKRKLLWATMLAVLMPILLSNAPTEWTERMDTVKAANTDSSFVGRLWAWKISVRIANDNFVGNGFYATQDPLAWQTYRYSIEDFGFVKTPPVPEDLNPKAAHSIYFQVLGDLGYFGLLLYLLIILTLFLKLNSLSRQARKHGIEWIEKLSSMMMISLVGYGITGANVSLAYFDLYFSMIGIAFVLKNRLLPTAIAKKEVAARHST